MNIRKVSFEHVSAVGHPEYYAGDYPAVRPDSVPDEHWTLTERQGDDVDRQYNGLIELMDRGELIRNVALYEAEAPSVPVWSKVK